MPHATAFLTTDPVRLMGPLAEVSVMNVDVDSADFTGAPLAEFVLDVDITGPVDQARAQDRAAQILANIGWKLTGPWEPTDSGARATVHREPVQAGEPVEVYYQDPPPFPEGSPEYLAYRAELAAELRKFAAGEHPHPYPNLSQ